MPPERKRRPLAGAPSELSIAGERVDESIVADEPAALNDEATAPDDPAQAERDLRAFVELLGPATDRVREVRVLSYGGEDVCASGFFADSESLVREVLAVPQDSGGSFITLNPLPALPVNRASNIIRKRVKATADADIPRRTHLLVDLDPVRASGSAATASEREAARALADRIERFLNAHGIQIAARVDTGNGVGLLIRIDLPGEDNRLVRRLLKALSLRFDTSDARVDRAVSNASRICRLPGTWNRKGEDTPERPHRRARLVYADPSSPIASAQALEAVISACPRTPTRDRAGATSGPKLDVGDPLLIDMTRKPMGAHGRGSRRARVALDRECATVAQTAEGARNSTLNSAAFSLGQLVATNELESAEVESALTTAALAAGLDESEIAATIRSGIEAGMTKPREDAPRVGTPSQPERPMTPPAPGEAAWRASWRQDVFVPGAHYVPPDWEYWEQPEADFVRAALKALPSDALYLNADAVGEVRDGEFREVDEHRLRGLLSESMRLVAGKKSSKPNVDGPEYSVVTRPINRDYSSLILANASAIRAPLRELAAIVTSPTLRGDGTVFDAPGYDRVSRTLYAPARTYPAFNSDRTDADVRQDVATLRAPFVDFPFAADIDRAALLACMLALVARPAIRGNMPGLIVLAPDWRVGKGLLVEGCTVAMTGRLPRASTAPGGRADDRAAEWEKRIVAMLRTAPRVVMIDNLRDGSHLQSDSLAAMLTAPGGEYEGRELGTSRVVRVVNRALWVFTGCNATVEGDLAGRLLSIRLVADDEHPERREFQIKNLRKHIHEHHPALVMAALGVLRRFDMVGRPHHGGAHLGGFESWDEHVRSAVVWATALCGWRSDPCDTLTRLQGVAADRDGLGSLFSTWHALIGERSVPVRVLVARAQAAPELRDALGGMGWGELDCKQIGIGLRKHADRVRDGLVLRRGDDCNKVATWAVFRLGSPKVPPGSPSGSPTPETAFAGHSGAFLDLSGGPRGTFGRTNAQGELSEEESTYAHAHTLYGVAENVPQCPPGPPVDQGLEPAGAPIRPTESSGAGRVRHGGLSDDVDDHGHRGGMRAGAPESTFALNLQRSPLAPAMSALDGTEARRG